MTLGKTPLRRSSRRGVFGLLPLLGALAITVGCGSADSRPATWTFISTAILQPSCATANCHSALAARASVDLSDRAVGYTSLVGRNFAISRANAVMMAAMMNAVAPTDEERVARSPVLFLMRADGNLRMPPDLPLSETDIQLIEKWIREGATAD